MQLNMDIPLMKFCQERHGTTSSITEKVHSNGEAEVNQRVSICITSPGHVR